uniref:Putative UDP-glucose:tetrahydrobiopterin glucosyltransferase n=1 Tax=Paulinella chromatophora TaxID=39717 RepID=B1X5D1_PAUCH|nr:putative UDP-glucose:tetrahydrobiopterin glucosyltransferase [Paulinella chromatophora]ACB43150.1 putative UDP-glucose:tetrahydrobiopterin glucosyltransferase [Paulinella chromatophora]
MLPIYRILVVSTPIGAIGSGKGGGVELTLTSLVAGLILRGHKLTVLAPAGSTLPVDCKGAHLETCYGINQDSWQHNHSLDSITIPNNGILPRLWSRALQEQERFDLILNLAYDWLPLWITPHVTVPIFHLISMGSVSSVMDQAILHLASWDQRRLAFHTKAQASDFELPEVPIIVSNGFNLKKYDFSPDSDNVLGWVGRIAPEKGLEDAVLASAQLGMELKVWGLKEDASYVAQIENLIPSATINWQGFLPTVELQKKLGRCHGLLTTSKWNEAFGNVVIEAMACGVPAVVYHRGGPGELVEPGINGWLVPPDDITGLIDAVSRIRDINRFQTRSWTENNFSISNFALRLEEWFNLGLN